ncbi:N-acetyltransferase [Iodidimonas sp. SYSU 1G8]|uniref:GNAT family N-acetyltransferase n=1 Tax=Iodidimonas sp. SYSU 1G8 TaxID=3133967 RepID=UPI0031FE5D8A
MITIRTETALDIPARESLLDRALPGRHLKTCEKIRRGQSPAEGLAFSAFKGDTLVGTVRLWHIRAGSADALLLGPIGVLPECQGLGIGTLLMDHALAAATARGHGAVILVGDAPYYERFGFTTELVRDLTLPGPVERDRFLAIELIAGALAGASGMIVAGAELEDDRWSPQALPVNPYQDTETARPLAA